MKKLFVLSMIALGACTRGESPRPDSALAADLALAAQQQTAQPQFRDTAPSAGTTGRIESAPRVRVTPRQPAVAQAAAEVGATRAAIGAGTAFSLASQQRICTTANRPGDRFVATVTNPVLGVNGAVVPAGSSVVLEVVAMSEGTNGGDGTIRLAVRTVDFNGRSYPVTGEVFSTSELERSRLLDDPNADKKKVIGGAAVGAVLGKVFGKSTKATVIGAAAGAATGAAAAKATQQFEGCLPVGGRLHMTLSDALVL